MRYHMNTNITIHVSNERGGMAALLSVITLSMIIVSTLSSFYIYIENRAKYQERIRIGYQMGYVMEDLGRAVIEARLAGMEVESGGSCPAGTVARWLDCTRVCLPNVRELEGIGNAVPQNVTHAVCVKSGNLNRFANNSDYYCTYNIGGNYGETRRARCNEHESGGNTPGTAGGGQGVGQLDLDDIEKSEVVVKKNKSKIRSWYARLDNFFDTTVVKNVPVVANQIQDKLNQQIKPPTLLGWLIPEKAFAQTGGENQNGDCLTDPFCRAESIQAQINRIGNASTGCVGSNDPRCQRCNNMDRINGTCVRFALCPPWIPTEECDLGEDGSNPEVTRIFQAVRIAGTSFTPPPPPPPPGSCVWECVDCNPGPSSACSLTGAPVGESCTNAGQMLTGRVFANPAGIPIICDPWAVRCVCGGGGGGGPPGGTMCTTCETQCPGGGSPAGPFGANCRCNDGSYQLCL